jgi:SAM-dependent methyltransferase
MLPTARSAGALWTRRIPPLRVTTGLQYAEALFDELSRKPFDRLLLDKFATHIRGHGEVWDIGCGPGHVGRCLHERGVATCGQDLSEGMIACARQLNPGMPSRQGSMLTLDTLAGSLAGIVCFYAIIHLRRHEAVSSLREFRRTLQPGGPVLLAFHGGAGELHSTEMLGEPLDVTATLFECDEMAGYARCWLHRRRCTGAAALRVRVPKPQGVSLRPQTRRSKIMAESL